MKVLVVGGAGYIGSHMTKALVTAKYDVVVLDNLSTGFKKLAKYGELIVGDIGNQQLLNDLFKQYDFDVVMHFAAASLVGESMLEPAKYYQNNVSGTLTLLNTMRKYGVKKFIFSSTAATFGDPQYSPIDEAHPQVPINPYGSSKLMVERILMDYASAYGINSVSLRYFNACGADPEGELGECHEPETHLIPLILQAASGRRDEIKVFGRDYDTTDGTCIRDYVHVYDLCTAHRLAIDYLADMAEQTGAFSFNLGNGHGFSVQEVIDVAKEVVARDDKAIKVADSARRPGDPAKLVADARKAKLELGWETQFPDLTSIIEHAWAWEKGYPWRAR